MSHSKTRAAHLLNHYLTRALTGAGVTVDRDTDAEIEEIVTSIIDATCDEVHDRIMRAARDGAPRNL